MAAQTSSPYRPRLTQGRVYTGLVPTGPVDPPQEPAVPAERRGTFISYQFYIRVLVCIRASHAIIIVVIAR